MNCSLIHLADSHPSFLVCRQEQVIAPLTLPTELVEQNHQGWLDWDLMLADVEQGREAEKDKRGWWLFLMFNGKILNYGNPLH